VVAQANGWGEGAGTQLTAKGQSWERVEQIFHQALERLPDARDAWLKSACAGEPGLHSEVASLLESDSAAGGLFTPPSGPLRRETLEHSRELLNRAAATTGGALDDFGVLRQMEAAVRPLAEEQARGGRLRDPRRR
jgi:hypothetical protein